METFSLLLLIIPFLSSYPTYEEWKRRYFSFNLPRSFSTSSYPTYEEWKHSLANPILSVCNTSSYPTYEEWKLHMSDQFHMAHQFLSYL